MVRYNNELDQYECYYHIDDHVDVSGGRRHRNGEHFTNGINDTNVYRDQYLNMRDTRKEPGNSIDPGKHAEDRAFPFVGHALSGAVGAALVNLVTYPFEVVSTRRKVQRYALAQRQEQDRRPKPTKGRPTRGSSSSSSSLSGDDVNPIFNVDSSDKKVFRKYTTEKDGVRVTEWEYEYEEDEMYHSAFDGMAKIYSKEGISGFYHGVGWDIMGDVTSGFCYFIAYNMLRKHRLKVMAHKHRNGGHIVPIVEEFAIGIIASALAKIVSMPLSNIVTRKQTSTMLSVNGKYPSVLEIYHDIMKEKGITGFWSGYTASLLLGLNPSITFLLFETLKPHVLEHRGHMDKLDIFLLAALSKAAATTLTYPLNVVRIRSQMEENDDEIEMHEGLERFSSERLDRRGRLKEGLERRYRRSVRRAKGVVDLLTEIIKKEGITALYVGIGASLAKGFLSLGVTMGIRETVHHFILKLYFFVLDAYNETGSYSETAHRVERRLLDKSGAHKLTEKTKEGVYKLGHAVGRAKRHVTHGVTDVVEGVGHLGEQFREKTRIGHHHSPQTDNFSARESALSREDRIAMTSFKNQTDEGMFEEQFRSSGGPVEERSERTTIIREDRIPSPPSHLRGEELHASRHETRHQTRHDNSLAELRSRRNIQRDVQRDIPSKPVVRTANISITNTSNAVMNNGSLVGTPPVPASKTMEKVAAWRDQVAEEAVEESIKESVIISQPPPPHLSRPFTERSVTSRHESHGSIQHPLHDPRLDPRHSNNNHNSSFTQTSQNRRLVFREPSVASGQSYRSAGARTSLLVHPSSSVRGGRTGINVNNTEWVDDAEIGDVRGEESEWK